MEFILPPNTQMKLYRCSIKLFHDVANSTNPGIFVGLDVRARYVGVAVGDITSYRACPLCVLEKKENNINQIATDLRRLVTEFEVGGLLVGHPPEIPEYKRDATLVQAFVDDLIKTSILEGVKYAYLTERFKARRVDCLLEPFALDHNIVSMNGEAGAVELLQDYLKGLQKYFPREI